MAEEKKKHKCPFCPPEKPCGLEWCSWNTKDPDKEKDSEKNKVLDD